MQKLSHTKERFHSLQVVRGLAALGVLLFHVERYTNIVGGITDSLFNHVPHILGQGAFWFFEISGFIMAYLIDQNLNKNFLVQRTIRIYPPYFLAVILSIFLFVMFLGSYETPRRDLLQALTLLPLGNITYVLRVEWSLTYEVFFYMVCTILAIGIFRKYYLHFLVVWLLIIIGSGFQQSSLLLQLHEIPFSQYNLYFILGGFVYYINNNYKIKNGTLIFIIAGVFIPLYYLLFYLQANRLLPPSTLSTLLLSIAFAGILYSILQIKTSPTNVLVKLGDYSYGIYLTHVPIIVITFNLWTQFIGKINTLAGLIALMTALTFGWNFGRLEVSLHHWIKKQPKLQRTP